MSIQQVERPQLMIPDIAAVPDVGLSSIITTAITVKISV